MLYLIMYPHAQGLSTISRESPGAKSQGGIPDSASGIATGSATHPEITRRPRPFFEATCAPMVYKCQIISGKRQFPACCETPACSRAKSGFLGENKEMLRAAKLMEGNRDSHRHHCGVLRGAGRSALGRVGSGGGGGGVRRLPRMLRLWGRCCTAAG